MDYQIHPEISHQSNWATVGFQQNPSNTNGPRGRYDWASPILCDHMDCSLLGSSVCGILQARILEWVAMPSSRGSSWPRDQTRVSCIAGGFFTIWAIRKVQRGAFPYRKRFPFSIKSWSYHSEIIDEVYMSLVICNKGFNIVTCSLYSLQFPHILKTSKTSIIILKSSS